MVAAVPYVARPAADDEALTTAVRIAADCARTVRHLAAGEKAAAGLILQIWDATARVILKELESGKSVSVQSLGVFELCEIGGSHNTRPDLDSCINLVDPPAREPHFTLSDDFKRKFGLSGRERSREKFQSGPSLRFATGGVAIIAEVSRDVAQSMLSAMISCVGEAMARSPRLVVSFAPLGNLWCTNGVVHFEAPKLEGPPSAYLPSPTVRNAVLRLQGRPGHHASSQTQAKLAQTLQSTPTSPPVLQTRSRSTTPHSILHRARLSSSYDCHRARQRRPASRGHGQPEKTLHRELHPDSALFPQLLRDCSRTRAVPAGGAQEQGSPSSRIAVGYGGGPASRLVTQLPGLRLRSLHWQPGEKEAQLPDLLKPALNYERLFSDRLVADGSPLDLELEEAGLSRVAFYECLHRYNYYVSESVPAEAIAPFNSTWTQNIEALLDLRKFGRDLSSFSVESMVSNMREEVLSEYCQALQKAVVDYALGDVQTQQRLGILFLPNPVQPWGTVPFVGVEGTHGGPPEAWRPQLAENRPRLAAALETCSRSALRLLDLWQQDYDELLLVQLPRPRAGQSGLVELEAFCQAQTSHRSAVRRQFEECWLRRATDILREEPAEGVPHNYPAFYEAISTLLSTQVRSTVEKSIAAYVGFFRRFAREAPRSPHAAISLADTDEGELEDAFLKVRLTADGGEVRFDTPLEQVAERLLGIFREFLGCLHGLERPDSKLMGVSEQAESTYLWDVSPQEQHVREAENFVAKVVGLNVANVERALLLYNNYKHLLHEEERVRELVEDLSLTREDFMDQVNKLRATEDTIRGSCPNEIRLQMVSIDCAEINETLCHKAGEAVRILLQAVLRNLLLKNDQLIKSFETVVNHMVRKPTSEVELVDLESHVADFRSAGLRGLLEEFEGIRAWLGFLFECEDRLSWALLSDRHFQAIYDSAHWVSSIDQIVREREANLPREREALESKFIEQRSKFLEDLDGYNALVDRLRDCGSLRQVDDYLERIQVLRNQFARAHAEAEKLNSKEARLGWEMSSFDRLKKGEQALNPHYELWTLVYSLDKAMRQWLRGPVFQLDPAKVEAEVNSMNQEAQDLKELFRGLQQPTPASVAWQLESQLFVMISHHISLAQALCNKCLRQRHWEEISAVVGFAIDPNSAFTLSRLDDLEVGKHIARLQEISEAATQENSVERLLDAMEAEWQPMGLEMQAFRDSGASIVASSSIEEAQVLLQDHQGKTRSVREGASVAPLVSRIASWEDWLNLATQILERWAHLQALWTSVQPVFSSHDLLRQLPTECRLFQRADRSWRRLLGLAEAKRATLELTREPGLLSELDECCARLEEVQEGLQDFFQSKGMPLSPQASSRGSDRAKDSPGGEPEAEPGH